MSKDYVDYMVEETRKILAIDSPSGYTREVADYVMEEYKKLGYEPQLTVKGRNPCCNWQAETKKMQCSWKHILILLAQWWQRLRAMEDFE